jgi:tetratricopeptide (TPR) repeat protein
MSRARGLSRKPWWLAGPTLILALALWPTASKAELRCDYDENGLPRNCTQVPSGGGVTDQCDWECKEYNRQQRREYQQRKAAEKEARRQQAREYRAWKANDKGNKAMERGDFAKARAYYDEALSQVPNYSYALSNLGVLQQNEFYFNQVWAREALDRGDFGKAHAFFGRALALAYTPEYRADMERRLAEVDRLSRYKPAGSLMMLGTGSQTGWHAPKNGLSAAEETQAGIIRDQLALARRDLPEGVDLELFNIGMGIAVSTSEAEDLFRRVLADQWASQPVPRSGMSGYNSIKGKYFSLLGCHSNGAMTCLYALGKGDAAARDVVLYGPQITPVTARLWQGLLEEGKIRSLRLVINQGDPIPPLALAVNAHNMYNYAKRALLFNGVEMDLTLAELIPSAQIDVRSCAFKLSSPFSCHRMTAYPQCKASRLSEKTVPGTKGFLDRRYTEPPPPNC